jgi:hypothetical protein
VVSGLRPNRIDRPGTAEESWASWPELRHLPPGMVAHFTRPQEVLLS